MSNKKWKMKEIFVAFSEYLNFNAVLNSNQVIKLQISKCQNMSTFNELNMRSVNCWWHQICKPYTIKIKTIRHELNLQFFVERNQMHQVLNRRPLCLFGMSMKAFTVHISMTLVFVFEVAELKGCRLLKAS